MASNNLNKVTTLKSKTLRYKLTETAVNNLEPRAKVYNVYDTEVRNLFVRVQVSGSKAFYVKKNKKTRKLGDVGVISVVAARQDANLSLAEGIEASKHLGKSLSKAFDEYLTSREFSSGYDSNVNQCRRICLSLLERPLASLTKADLISTITRAKKIDGEPYSDSTIDSVINVLSSIFTYQIALDVIDDNPSKNIKKRLPKLKLNKRSNKLMTREDINEFTKWFFQFDGVTGRNLPTGVSIKNIKDFELTRLVGVFLLLSGCRISEALKLRKVDIKKEERVLVAGRFTYTLTFRETKNGSDLTLFMPNHLYLIVKKAMGLTPKSEYVFLQKGVSENAMYSRLESSLSKIVIEGQSLNIHDLRRTAAYQMAMAGMKEPGIGIILNHNSGSRTHRYIGDQSKRTFNLLKGYHKFLSSSVYRIDEDAEMVESGLALFSDSKSDPVRYYPHVTDGGLDELQEFEREGYYS